MIFVIEHLEPRLSKWCMLEYAHISTIVGKRNVWFSHVSRPSKRLGALGLVFSAPAKELSKELSMKNPCVLDPEARETLSYSDCKTSCKKFTHLIFGGILGNDPPQQRTREIFQDTKVERRNLGHIQMSTDTAVAVAKKISEGTPFSTLKFKDTLEINLKKGESVILPYRYVLENGKPMLPKGFADFLKNRRSF